MATFNYNPIKLNPVQMPKLGGNVKSQLPKQSIKNAFAKNIFDILGKNIKPVTGYSSQASFQDRLAPTQMLGQEFIQQAFLPEFQQNLYNPYRGARANQSAASNLDMMGTAADYLARRDREITQPFIDQAAQIQDTFNAAATDDLNRFLKDYYSSQISF